MGASLALWSRLRRRVCKRQQLLLAQTLLVVIGERVIPPRDMMWEKLNAVRWY